MSCAGLLKPVQLRTSAFTAGPLQARRARTSLVVQAVQDVKGRVVSLACDKTAVIEVVKLAPHPVYMKRSRNTKTYIAHDENSECRLGDYVRLEGCRPLSKRKRFFVAEIIQRKQ